MEINLTNKIAVVTGASGQLGRVIARTLAKCGATIVVHYHQNRAMAETLVNEISALNVHALAIQADVTQFESILQMRDTIKTSIGPADIIVNNAVVQYPWTSVMDQSPGDYESQFKSCVMHNVYMAKAFVPDMIKKKWGRVIAINTECAMQNFVSQSAYVSGKRGMDGMLRVLAKEIGEHQITVNQVAPGWMISEKERSSSIDADKDYRDAVPLKMRGEDTDVANTVAFLASDLARFITGAYLPVCGGNVMPAI